MHASPTPISTIAAAVGFGFEGFSVIILGFLVFVLGLGFGLLGLRVSCFGLGLFCLWVLGLRVCRVLGLRAWVSCSFGASCVYYLCT
jgi:hypothetical protein